MLLHKAIMEPLKPDYGLSFAAAVFAFLPILLVFICGNRFYLRGLFSGGLKG